MTEAEQDPTKFASEDGGMSAAEGATTCTVVDRPPRNLPDCDKATEGTG